MYLSVLFIVLIKLIMESSSIVQLKVSTMILTSFLMKSQTSAPVPLHALQRHSALRQNQSFSLRSWYIKDDINPVIPVTWSGLQRKVYCFPWMNLVPDSTKR